MTVVLTLSILIPMFIAPMATNKFLNQGYEIVASNLGIVYLVMGLLTLLFLLILAMSRYGNIKLGKEDEKPEYGNFGWASMLFCCGIGASLVLYGTTEWVDYYLKPPFGAEPKSSEAMAWASTYGMFHWGIIGWAIYCFPGVAIGYSYYVRNSGSLKTSTGCEAILGNQRNGNLARAIDLIYMIALVGVLGAGLGLTSPVVSATITEFFSIEQNLTITVSCLLVCMLIYSISLYFGVEEGIQRLSKLCAYMAFFVLLYILIFGPTLFLIKSSYESLMFMVKNFFTMSLGPPPIGKSEFSKAWTIFMWAWFFGLGPFVGIFIARISRGRSIRSMILGALGFGTMGTSLFFMIMGNNAMYLEINGIMPIIDIWSNESPAVMVSKSISGMPLGKWILPFVGVFCLVFMATTFDSGAYTLASSATKKMKTGEDPEIWNRIFWAFFIALLPLALLIGAADSPDLKGIDKLKPFQTIVLLISPPLLLVYIMMGVGLIKSILEDTKTN
ncbi:BCCT family transporter [Gammaproteobacteria bacterium]|nr:BCCT family transporter [Gammaproteobacteria bacterium]